LSGLFVAAKQQTCLFQTPEQTLSSQHVWQSVNYKQNNCNNNNNFILYTFFKFDLKLQKHNIDGYTKERNTGNMIGLYVEKKILI